MTETEAAANQSVDAQVARWRQGAADVRSTIKWLTGTFVSGTGLALVSLPWAGREVWGRIEASPQYLLLFLPASGLLLVAANHIFTDMVRCLSYNPSLLSQVPSNTKIRAKETPGVLPAEVPTVENLEQALASYKRGIDDVSRELLVESHDERVVKRKRGQLLSLATSYSTLTNHRQRFLEWSDYEFVRIGARRLFAKISALIFACIAFAFSAMLLPPAGAQEAKSAWMIVTRQDVKEAIDRLPGSSCTQRQGNAYRVTASTAVGREAGTHVSNYSEYTGCPAWRLRIDSEWANLVYFEEVSQEAPR